MSYNYRVVSHIISKMDFDSKLPLLEYPYTLQNKIFSFYFDGEGRDCFPVTIKEKFVQIHERDTTTPRPSGDIALDVLKDKGEGTYIIDFKRKKLVYDVTNKKTYDYFSQTAPDFDTPFYLVLCRSLENSSEEIKLLGRGLNCGLLGLASLITHSYSMITPIRMTKEGTALYKEILTKNKLIPSPSNTVDLRSFLVPSLAGINKITEESSKGLRILFDKLWPQDNKSRGEIVVVETDEILLSKIIEDGKLPLGTNGKNVVIDVFPEGIYITYGYIKQGYLYLVVKNDLKDNESYKKVKEAIDLDFVCFIQERG